MAVCTVDHQIQADLEETKSTQLLGSLPGDIPSETESFGLLSIFRDKLLAFFITLSYVGGRIRNCGKPVVKRS
ncbi:MAG: hypothetical protein DMG05_14570 [Acidobacteria bacterium]|nr:MAG: hypothetical protein DMG05_14570 [Acidobacteriota bacterium]